ncbi:endo-beta-N-acetylglucosaminidase [Flavobacterium sp. RHBU_3]|uniref:endo-beta-N-acetylglucosaminidase n=1 Tax=Flavobacterium sp. RHBU_3 TaxID=3391184 RepID=UPI003984D963
MKKITLLSCLLFGGSLCAQIVNQQPYILTIAQLKEWTQDGATASADLVCTVPLASRFTNTETQFNPNRSNSMQIAYLPDGMNNFGNYYGEQSQFNLYNFTHWAYIDKFVWFGGTSSQTVQVPSSPWANAAHRNGVKIFGDIFFSPTAYGGSTATLQSFLEQDTDGNFIVLPKLIDIMQYYNFDGWFINQETATNSTVAGLMRSFVQQLTAAAEAEGKEVMWYDAMTTTGSVGWQNRLNTSNSPFVQANDDGDSSNGYETRVSSSIFINFFWSGSTYPSASRTRAGVIGRSEFDVFTGADIWPGRNQGNFSTNGNSFMGYLHENASTPYTSLGLFATNCVYNSSAFTNFNNDPTDVDSFYSAENHMFAGYDRNPAIEDATNFKGFGNWVPATSVITTLPFETSFCTGHGTQKFEEGVQSSGAAWHNVEKQDILPTWEWAFSENDALTAKWDFNDAYNMGNSIKVTGALTAGNDIDLSLYKTKLTVAAGTGIDIALKGNVNPSLWLTFADSPAQRIVFPLADATGSGWEKQTVVLPAAYTGKEIAVIGLRFSSDAGVDDYVLNVGSLKVYQDDALLASEYYTMAEQIAVSYPQQDKTVLFNINLAYANQVAYTVYDLQGKAIRNSTIKLNGTTEYAFNTSGISSGIYIVKFAADNGVTETKKIIVR